MKLVHPNIDFICQIVLKLWTERGTIIALLSVAFQNDVATQQ